MRVSEQHKGRQTLTLTLTLAMEKGGMHQKHALRAAINTPIQVRVRVKLSRVITMRVRVGIRVRLIKNDKACSRSSYQHAYTGQPLCLPLFLSSIS
jgi:hypothetical protein